jgi:hypothetical protein
MVNRSQFFVSGNGRLVNPQQELEYSDFLGIGIGKKAKQRQAERKAERHEHRIELATIKNASKLALAEQGISAPSGFSKVLSSVGNLAASLTGRGTTESMITDQADNSLGTQAEAAKLNIVDPSRFVNEPGGNNPLSKQNLPYFIGGILLFVVLIIVLLKRKK